MEATNGMSGRMLSSVLGLEMPLQQQQQQQQQPQQHFTHPHYPQPTKQNTFSYPTKLKQQQYSDEDEAEDTTSDGKKKISPWQRMKWTDNMVRLLIMVVYYIGDDCGNEGNEANKKKAGGILQKKGKWKSVSRAMMEKGFYVSPQQCEDKFNDLNKRYKRVNDILGKGTSCRVVENQGLLDTMDHINPKLKEEVRKLLNSKHLFFKEMCAYHNSGANTNGHMSSEGTAVELSHQRQCFHSAENGTGMGGGVREGFNNVNAGRSREVVDVDEDEDDNDDDNDDNEDDDDDETEGGSVGCRSHENNGDYSDMVSSKRQRQEMFTSPVLKQMSSDLVSVLQDGTKSPWEQRHWMMSRMIELEEQKVSYESQAFELEKQRLKWLKFSAKKEREMERLKLNNDRMKLENDRMVLLFRKKELEFFHNRQQQHSSNK